MSEKYQEIVALNKRYWFDHQSPNMCLLGSDGVGHDFIHPADQLQAACRNATSLYHASEDMKDQIALLELDYEDMAKEGTKRSEIKRKQIKRHIAHLRLQQQEREMAFEVYYGHAKALLPEVSKRYDHIDEAMPEIWATRIAYNAAVKNHPLGHDLKVALMTEDQKTAFMDFMHEKAKFPKMPTPNAELVLQAVNDDCQKLRELHSKGANGWQKIIGSNLDPQIPEPTQD